MKVVAIVAVAFTALVGGGAAWNNSAKSPTTPHSENLTVQTHTLSGNISEDLKGSSEADFSTVNKTISKNSVDARRVVYFNREVDFLSVKAAVDQLKKLEKESSAPIWLLIDSPGGSVLDGATLISQMEASKAPVYTVCTRLCASMAAMFHSYGAKRYSLDRALLMYHPASAGVNGQVPNMMSLLKTLTRYINKMNANIVKRSKISKSDFDSLVAYELWIDSEDALQKGLIDGIVSLDVPSVSLDPNQGSPESSKINTNTNPRRATINVEMIAPDFKR